MVRPRALAVLRLITRPNFVGCWIGRSAGLAPFQDFIYIDRSTSLHRGRCRCLRFLPTCRVLARIWLRVQSAPSAWSS